MALVYLCTCFPQITHYPPSVKEIIAFLTSKQNKVSAILHLEGIPTKIIHESGEWQVSVSMGVITRAPDHIARKFAVEQAEVSNPNVGMHFFILICAALICCCHKNHIHDGEWKAVSCVFSQLCPSSA